MKKLLFALVLLFSLVPTFAQQKNKVRLQAMYDSIKAAGIRHPEYVMGQCIQETGWLAVKMLPLPQPFRFYIKGNKCKKFTSEADCIAYYKTWQDKRYLKWQKKHPKQDYYHFLKSVGYATGEKYTRELKPKVEWVKRNLKL
jgi:hypothetical protein